MIWMCQSIGIVCPSTSKTCEGQVLSETDEQTWQKLLLTLIQSPEQSREVLYGKAHAVPTASVNTVSL